MTQNDPTDFTAAESGTAPISADITPGLCPGNSVQVGMLGVMS